MSDEYEDKWLYQEIDRLKDQVKEYDEALNIQNTTIVKLGEQNAKLIEVLGGVLKVVPYRVNCYDLHHGKKDRHGANDPCPVVDRYEQLIDKAAILLREVQGE